MTLQENQSVLDLAIQLNGTLENSLLSTLNVYGIINLDEDLTSKNINPVYNTNSSVVNQFYLLSRNVVCGEQMSAEFLNVSFAAYSSEFSHDFDSF